jgi:hypothetical protein
VGFFSGKGSMSGRVVIPIENERGELVAYAGRSIDGSEAKYKLPAGFKKGQVLYNLARALDITREVSVIDSTSFIRSFSIWGGLNLAREAIKWLAGSPVWVNS